MGRRLQTMAAVACMKTMLMIFNFIFWLTGIGILAVGIWMKISLYKYLQLSEDYSDLAPYILIGTGAAIILVGSMACCCTIKGQSVMLYLFSIFLVMVFLLMLTAGASGYMYRGRLQKGFRLGLTSAIHKYNTSHSDGEDEIMNTLQSNLGCCGIDKYTDWFNVTWRGSLSNSVPASCCQHHLPQGQKCENLNMKTNETATIFTSGCYNKVVDFVSSNLGAIGGGVLAVAFFQLVGVMLAYCLARNINKGKYEPVD